MNHSPLYFGVRLYINIHTVKPVYNDHPWNQMIVVSVDRWSLYGGALVQLKWTMNQPTVVSIDRWSYLQVVFNTGFTVHEVLL